MRNFIKRYCLFVFFFISILSLQACLSSKKLRYFTNLQHDSTTTVQPYNLQTQISKNDILQIIITTPDDNMTRLLNSASINPSGTAAGTLPGYLVDDNGSIKLPMIGVIKAEGLTKNQLSAVITNVLLEKQIAKDPVVSVRIVNYKISVLGEVNHPGVFPVPNERITLPEALAEAGDLTVYGRRDNVLLIREANGQRIQKRFSLNKDQLFEKDIYNLQNQDIIYVEPANSRMASTDRTFQVIATTISLISLYLVIFRK